MYRINDRQEAVRRIQGYLAIAGSPQIFVAPTGVYDENTRLSVIDFKRENGLSADDTVDYETFTRLYLRYVFLKEIAELKRGMPWVKFPVMKGAFFDKMRFINASLALALDYYGITHRLTEGRHFSAESAMAVSELRRIYQLENGEHIDEEFMIRLIKDTDLIREINNSY